MADPLVTHDGRDGKKRTDASNDDLQRAELTPLAAHATTDTTPNVTPNMTPDVTPEVTTEVATEVATDSLGKLVVVGEAKPLDADGSSAESAPAKVSAEGVVKSDVTIKTQKQIVDALKAFAVKPNSPGSALDKEHKFWDTQPVPRLRDNIIEDVNGPIDKFKTPADVRQEPLPLPPSFEWAVVDLKDNKVLEEVYTLLNGHYVEDDDNMFRFDYQPEFLRWALFVPNYRPSWHIGVRATETQKLFAFITGTPALLCVAGKNIEVAEINFLCVHKKLRTKRLAPVLIKEVTRRVNLENVWQGLYTAGIVLPKPIAECQYHHRALNIKKLTEVRFSCLTDRLTLSRAIRLYKLPAKPQISGIRPTLPEDIPKVNLLLTNYLKKFKFYPIMSDEEATHNLLPRPGVIYSYVREVDGEVTDFTSFYSLPSSVIGNDKHSSLYAAYSFYNVATTVSVEELMHDALILAVEQKFDVFNALDIAENETFLKPLKFGVGDGSLRYYLYNWKVPPMKSNEIATLLV